MKSKNPKVRVISTKEAGKINKNNVAYYTLTDGTVAVVQNEGKEKSVNNMQKNETNSNMKYKRFNKYNQAKNNNIQPKNDSNPDYQIYKIKNSNQNNININPDNNYVKSGYQIIEAIPVKFCENPSIKNFSEPEPLYVQPYFNPDIIINEVESNYNNNYVSNQNKGFYQRKKY